MGCGGRGLASLAARRAVPAICGGAGAALDRAVRLSLVLVLALGGCLYAHLNTYIEPRNFDIMLGVHSLAYGLIGGLGTAFGPILGVLLDVGLLESVRVFKGYRMIVFGGTVAVLLVLMPRGILDEGRVRWLGRIWRRYARPKASRHAAA